MPEPEPEAVSVMRDLPEEPTVVSPVETRTLLPEELPSEDVPLGPLVLRVGLATDLESVELPCCDPAHRGGVGR